MSTTTAAPPRTARITVTDTSVIRHGVNRWKRPFTLLSVSAIDENGDPYPHELVTFDTRLPIGSPIDVELTEDTHSNAFVVKLPRTADDVRRERSAARAQLTGTRTKPPLNDGADVYRLDEARVRKLEAEIKDLRTKLDEAERQTEARIALIGRMIEAATGMDPTGPEAA